MRIAVCFVVAGIISSAGAGRRAYASAPCNLQDLTNAVRQNPKDTNAYIYRAICYMSFGPNDRRPSLKYLEAAVKDLEAALRLEPRNFFVHHNYAHVAYLLQYQDFAVYEFTKAIELNPRSGRSYLGRGWAYLEMCEFKSAPPDFQQAISLDPSLRREVATPQKIAYHHQRCAVQPPTWTTFRPSPQKDPYFDHNSDYWKLRRWEERPH